MEVVPGVWAAGNAVGFAEQIVNAAGAGYRAAATLNGELLRRPGRRRKPALNRPGVDRAPP